MKIKRDGKMGKVLSENFFGTERIGKILFKIAPPVMLAQLIQAFYNIADSFFVGKYSADALTAVSVIFPLQLIIIALAVGTGVGVNTYMARKYAENDSAAANYTAGTGMLLAILSWAAFAVVSVLLMTPYVKTSASEPEAVRQAVIYGNIVCIGSIGTFLEGCWTKVHQARGWMLRPMLAQIAGAVVNVVFDPLLIFGIGPFPELGIAGAAYATVFGQCISAVITFPGAFHMPPKLSQIRKYICNIYFYGYSSIFMQSLYTVYIAGLNIILAGFSDAAVTVLGLYYKMQSFFFIPINGLETCIIPVLSFNYTRGCYSRCRETMKYSFLIALAFMALGTLCFVFIPVPMIRLFSSSAQVIEIGRIAFPIIGISFMPAVFSLIMPVFFQAIGNGLVSSLLSLVRQVVCLLPIFWLLSKIGLNYTWISFPISETLTDIACLTLYFREIRKWKKIRSSDIPEKEPCRN